jgi:hypothetical protein
MYIRCIWNHKWILCLVLDPNIKTSHYTLEIFQNLKKNPKFETLLVQSISDKAYLTCVAIYTFFFFFLLGLGFELRASHTVRKAGALLLSCTSSSVCSGCFGDGGLMNYLHGMALNCDSPDLSLPSS